jgi:hypothetical protein
MYIVHKLSLEEINALLKAVSDKEKGLITILKLKKNFGL